MRKLVVSLLVATLLLGTICPVSSQAGKREPGGIVAFFVGCCLGVRCGSQWNEGVDLQMREWAVLIPYLGIVVSIWNGVSCASGMTGHEFAEQYGVNWY